ncbi:protein kinase domain-containing protein [Streptomyces sp. NPDC002306]
MAHDERALPFGRAPGLLRDGRGSAIGRAEDDLWVARDGLGVPRVVILTAALAEYRAVQEFLTRPTNESSASGAPYTVGSLTVEAGDWEVWVTCIGQGNIGAALQASHAVQELRPELIAFVGTAGSLKSDVRLGDVVYATKVYGYESAKLTDQGPLGRPSIEVTDPLTTQLAFRVAAQRSWLRKVPQSEAGGPTPEAHVAPIAAGEKIHAGNRSAQYDYLRKAFDDAHAVEMEGLGFLSGAAFWPAGTKAVVVRGVSDRLVDKAPGQDAVMQPTACRHAMALLWELLESCWPKADDVWARLNMSDAPRRVAPNPHTFVGLASEGGAATIMRREDIPALDLVGEVVDGRYRLLREVGRGSLNVVWEAEEFAFGGSLGRVAVKLQPPQTDKRYVYFSREAAIMARLDSPSLLPYRCAGTQRDGRLAGWSYICTALAELSLRDLVNEQPLQGSELTSMMRDVADGLLELHKQRLVHGDIKPANILRLGERWVIGDFGLTQKTGAHEPEGTIGYMAPERFGGTVTTKNDVYSFAVTAVVAGSGLTRSDERTLDSTHNQVLRFLATNVPEPPNFRDSMFPPPVSEIVQRSLRADPAERPSIQDVLGVLHQNHDRWSWSD